MFEVDDLLSQWFVPLLIGQAEKEVYQDQSKKVKDNFMYVCCYRKLANGLIQSGRIDYYNGRLPILRY